MMDSLHLCSFERGGGGRKLSDLIDDFLFDDYIRQYRSHNHGTLSKLSMGTYFQVIFISYRVGMT